MQPPNLRRFETRRERRKRDRSVKTPQGPPDLGLPEEGHAIVRDAVFECPCSQCADCGGTVELTAILWYDDWPVTTPEVGASVLEVPEGGPRVRTLHLSLAPTRLEAQRECSKGCEISPDDWETIESAAFLTLCRRYTQTADELLRGERGRKKP